MAFSVNSSDRLNLFSTYVDEATNKYLLVTVFTTENKIFYFSICNILDKSKQGFLGTFLKRKRVTEKYFMPDEI